MFSKPLRAHPAEVGRFHAAWHPHPRDDADDRDQHDAGADDKEEHRVVAAISRIAILTRGQLTVCALVHRVSVVGDTVLTQNSNRFARGQPKSVLVCRADASIARRAATPVTSVAQDAVDRDMLGTPLLF